jgi:hypothetical protein
MREPHEKDKKGVWKATVERIGVDTVCVGSRIFLKGTPKENYMKFVNKVNELEGIQKR